MAEDFRSFEDFWPFYVREHSKPLTRWFHFAGTSAAIVALGAWGKTRKPAYLAAALVGGYLPSWISHFFIENNRPATFKYPLWSLIGDLKMYGLIWQGKMDAEVARAHANSSAVDPASNGKSNGRTEPAPQTARHEVSGANRPN
jgi:hypothetical protein